MISTLARGCRNRTSCDVPVPVEPLEIRVTFCGNPESDMALVLSLDVLGKLGGRREVVLRDWGPEVRGCLDQCRTRNRFCTSCRTPKIMPAALRNLGHLLTTDQDEVCCVENIEGWRKNGEWRRRASYLQCIADVLPVQQADPGRSALV